METNKADWTACSKVFPPSRYTDWRPNLLHGMSTAVFVGSRTVDSLLPLLTPPACMKSWKIFAKPLGTGCDTHNKPNSARGGAAEKRAFSKTACTLAGHALFGRRVVPMLLPQLLRCEVEKCRCKWHGAAGHETQCKSRKLSKWLQIKT